MGYRMIVNKSQIVNIDGLISLAKVNLTWIAQIDTQHGSSKSSATSQSSLNLPSSPSSSGLILDGVVIGSVSVKSVTPTVNGQRGDTTTLSIAISGTIPRYNNVFTSDNVAQVSNYSALREWAFAS